MSNELKIAYGYARVSTFEQADAGSSIPAQIERMKGVPVIKPGVRLVGVYEDAGESASTLERPQLQILLNLCRENQADMVIVAKLDRLTRSVRDLYHLFDFFDAHEVTLVSLNEGLDTKTPTSRFLISVMASMSQWERETIAERTRESLSHLRSIGKRYGAVPFGYSVDEGGYLVPNMDEQEAYNYGIELLRQQYTYRQIAEALTARGFTNRRGKPYTKHGIFKILKDEKNRNWTPALV